jgi:hypothetical protein
MNASFVYCNFIYFCLSHWHCFMYWVALNTKEAMFLVLAGDWPLMRLSTVRSYIHSDLQYSSFPSSGIQDMASKRRLWEQDVAQELISDSDSDELSEDKNISPSVTQTLTLTMKEMLYRHVVHSGLMYQTWPFGPVIHSFTRGPSGLRQSEEPNIVKDCTWMSFFMLFFFEIIQLLVEETTDTTTNIWTCLMKETLLFLMWLVFICYCADGTQSVVLTETLILI